jgi:type IV secretory pathway VirB4 component
MTDPLLIAKGDNPLYLLPGMSNRHGLVAGATGTGKTVTLQVMAESFQPRGRAGLCRRCERRPFRNQPARQ